MFCPKCGNNLPDDALFCAKCGERIEAKAPVRQQDFGEPSSAPPTAALEAQQVGEGGLNVKVLAIVAIIVVVLVVVLVRLFACSGSGSENGTSQETVKTARTAVSADGRALAAKVNEVEIYEDDVARKIETVRESAGLLKSGDWERFLAENEWTPQSVRLQIVDSLVANELMWQHAADVGVNVSNEAVESYLESMSADEKKEAIDSFGDTNDALREYARQAVLQEKLLEHFASTVSSSNDADLLAMAQKYLYLFDGAKRSSFILFAADRSRDNVQSILDRIRSGAIGFEEAVKEYSMDIDSVERGGDVGWDVANAYIDEYQETLDALDEGQVSDIATCDSGYFVVKCTQVYHAPDTLTSLDQVPAQLVDEIKPYLAESAAADKLDEWVEGLRANADIVIYDMPADAPYDVASLSAYSSGSAPSATSNPASSALAEVDAVQPNLNEILTSDSNTAKQIVSQYKECDVGDEYVNMTLYSNNDSFAQLAFDVNYGYYDGDDSDLMKALNECKGSWAVELPDSASWYAEATLSSAQIAAGRNPDEATYITYLVLKDGFTSDDLAELVNRVTPFDRCFFGARDDSYVEGWSKGGGCLVEARAGEILNDGEVTVWSIKLYARSIQESESFYDRDFERWYSSFDSSKYLNSHKE